MYKNEPIPFFTREEADISDRFIYRNPRYITNWRDGKAGDWILTENNYVTYVLKRYKFGRANGSILLANGLFNTVWKQQQCIATKKKLGTSWDFPNDKPRIRPLSKSVRQFVQILAMTGNWDKACVIAFACGKRKMTSDGYNAEILAIKLELSRKFRRRFIMSLKQALQDVGFDEKFLIRKHKEILESGNKNSKTYLSALELGYKVLGYLTEKREEVPDNGKFAGFIDQDNSEPLELEGISIANEKLIEDSIDN